MALPVPALRDLLDDSWVSFRMHFRVIVLLTLAIHVPLGVLDAVGGMLARSHPQPLSLNFWLSNTLNLCIGTVWTMAIVTLATAQGERAAIGALLRVARQRYLPAVGVSLIYLLRVTLGCLLLIIPGFVMAVRYAFAIQFVMINGCGVRAAQRGSAGLVRGRAWRLVALLTAGSLPVLACIALTMRLIALFGRIPWVPLLTLFPSTLALAFSTLFATHLFLRLDGKHDRATLVGSFD